MRRATRPTPRHDWCVLRSNGEAGTYPHYLRMRFGATVHNISLYLHWDAETHSGWAEVGPTGSGSTVGNVYHNGAGQVLLWLHADLDEIHLIIKPQAQNNHYWTAYGRLKPDHLCYSGQAVQVPAAIEAGEGVVIALPSWPDWAEVGRKIYNWDTASLHELTITAVNEATRTITVAAAYNKASGSWLVEDMLLFCHRSYGYQVRGNDILTGLPQRANTAQGQPGQNNYYVSNLYYLWSVDGKYDKKLSYDILIFRQNEFRGRLALMRDAYQWGTTGQGLAWEDETGQPWRVYTAYNSNNIILKESI